MSPDDHETFARISTEARLPSTLCTADTFFTASAQRAIVDLYRGVAWYDLEFAAISAAEASRAGVSVSEIRRVISAAMSATSEADESC